MARTTIVRLTDDLDGSDADRTVEFGYNGKTYSLDLNERNASELHDALAPYIAAAEKAGSVRGRASGTARTGRGPARTRPAETDTAKADGDFDPKAVRAWAQANGVAVSPRGRIKADVVERYRSSRG